MAKKRKKTHLEELRTISRSQAIVALTLVLAVFFLLYAFSSFYQTGISDYTTEEDYKNLSGELGYVVANFFMNNGLGLGAYALVITLALCSYHFIWKGRVPLFKPIFFIWLYAIWFSIAMGYLFPPNGREFSMGGLWGETVAAFLKQKIGTTTSIAIGFMFIGILVLHSKKTLQNILTYGGRLQHKLYTLWANILKKGVFNDKLPEAEKDEMAEDDIDHNQTETLDIHPDSTSPYKVKSNQEAETEPSDSGLVLEITNTVPTEEEEEVFTPEPTAPLEVLPDATEEEAPFNPRQDLSNFDFPEVNKLRAYATSKDKVSNDELQENQKKIEETLGHYGITISKIRATVGPTVTLYEIIPSPGIRISKIKNLEDDIALSLAALGIRIIAPIPGKGTIGIEVPNLHPEIVPMRSIIGSKVFQETSYELPLALGRTITNETYMLDLAKLPHLLVAGSTGQGKSVGINAMITSLLYKKHPAELKLVLIDPKKVELNLYSIIEKYYLAKMENEEEPIVTDVQKVKNILNSLTTLMDDRYDLLKKAHARNLKEYNQKFIKRRLNPHNGHHYMPYVVVVIDEFADLIMTAGKEIEQPIARIAQLARAVGIHMIIATQRPSTNIITGSIKANFPARIAFKVASMIDSRTILDMSGAQQLIGKGDMLVAVGSEMVRVQCAFIDTEEVEEVNKYISSQQSYPTAFYLPEVKVEGGKDSGEAIGEQDALFEEAARLVVLAGAGSTSSIQRRFSIGYNRAGRIMDQLEHTGIVGPAEGSKPREVLILDEVSLEKILNSLN